MIEKIRRIKAKDIRAFFLVAIAFIPGLILRQKSKIWLISERKDDAKDNGFYLFKYLRLYEKNVEAFYSIDLNSKDFDKIKNLGNVIQFGSFKHYIYTWACRVNVSSQIGAGYPNSKICYTLQRLNIFKSKFVFLQHGVTCNKPQWLLAKYNKVDLFCCASEQERKFVANELGYGNSAVTLGFCRFDGLDNINKQRQILFMPTWRSYLFDSDIFHDEKQREQALLRSEYYIQIMNILKNKELQEKLQENNIKLIFYLHDNAQPYESYFKTQCKWIINAKKEDFDIQTLLKESSYLITDYSSVAFDFAYLKKPVLYYQFDYKEFRSKHYEEGYFKYDLEGFGEVAYTSQEALGNIIAAIDSEFENHYIYQERAKKFFYTFDQENCKRTYEAISCLL